MKNGTDDHIKPSVIDLPKMKYWIDMGDGLGAYEELRRNAESLDANRPMERLDSGYQLEFMATPGLFERVEVATHASTMCDGVMTPFEEQQQWLEYMCEKYTIPDDIIDRVRQRNGN